MAGSARDQAALLPLAPGVYRFRDANGRILYLDRATRLRSRVASYWGDLGGRAHLGGMVARVARVEAVACDSAREAAWLERNRRLAGWTQRACGAAAARRHLARTPPGWMPFAQRNAELAARLTA